MLQLSFNNFMEKFKEEKKFNPLLHYVETEEDFRLFFKSFEKWEYFVTISKEDIESFGQNYNVDREQSIKDFKIEYLSHALQVEFNQEIAEEMSEQILVNKTIDAGKDIVMEANDYADFMEKTIEKMKQSVISNLKHLELKTQKTFGQFLRGMMNVVNTKAFMAELRRHIKKNLSKGMEEAEKELEVNVEWTMRFDNKLTALEGQQLNGYTINGKMWHGIKGATKQVQDKILQQVDESVRNKESKDVLASKIMDIFEGSTMSQAKRIARTETNRFINEGKLTSYKDVGLKGHKAWTAVPKQCCELCNRLQSKYFDKGIPLDDKFIDDKTGKSYEVPPSHPNCFLAGTKIKTDKGTKNIEKIVPGDYVLTHKHRNRKVLRTMVSESDDYYELVVGKGRKQRTLKVTGNHPVLTTNGWKEVQELSLNDKVLFYDS